MHVLDDPSVTDLRLAEDHAHLVSALLSAHESTGEADLLAEALAIHAETERLFVRDDVVWMTPAETDLPVRPREQADDPAPSGAATTAENAVRLGRLAGDERHDALAERLLARSLPAASAPHQSGATLAALAAYLRR